MSEQNAIITVVVSATLLAIALILQSRLEKWLELKERQLKNQAVFECGQVAKVEWQDRVTGAQVNEPYKEAYLKCLQDKGY